MARPVGWLTLAFAACGWLLLWNLISTLGIFCGGGPVDCPSLLAIGPRYLALAGMGLSAVGIAVALDRKRAAPRWVGIGATVAAAIALVLLLVATVNDYDGILSSMTSGRLDAPYRPPALPALVGPLSAALWPVFLGAWVTLASLEFVRLGVPRPIAGVGVVAGIVVVVTMPYGLDFFVRTSVLPLELIVSLVWATAVGVHFTTTKGAMAVV